MESIAERAATSRLFLMPERIGMFASASTFLRFVMNDLPGRKEKPRWI